MKVSASKFISTLTNIDPDYILVPSSVDLEGVEVVRLQRGDGSGYTYPDGIYYSRDYCRFEELVTVKN